MVGRPWVRPFFLKRVVVKDPWSAPEEYYGHVRTRLILPPRPMGAVHTHTRLGGGAGARGGGDFELTFITSWEKV